MSDFGLANLKMECDFVHSKLLPIQDVPIVHFMDTLKGINSEYNKYYYNSMFYISWKPSHISPYLIEIS